MNIAVLASTRGTDLQAIINAIHAGTLTGVDLKCVVSNKKNCFALERAKKAGIKTYFVSSKNMEREDYDREIAYILESEEVELIVLVGYMRLFSAWFVEKYQNQIINVHPSLLPKHPGMDLNVHQEVLDDGDTESGCTIFFVDEGKDTGPIILQKSVPVAEDETVESLKEKVQELEKEWYPQVIQWIADGKVKVEGREVTIQD